MTSALPEVLEKLERLFPGHVQLWGDSIEMRSPDDTQAVAGILNWLKEHGPALLRDAGDGWLPIESAPRDGTYVLLFGELEQPYVSNYDTFRDGFGDKYTGWVSPDAGELGPGLMSPTHWRPLPQPPAMHAPGGD